MDDYQLLYNRNKYLKEEVEKYVKLYEQVKSENRKHREWVGLLNKANHELKDRINEATDLLKEHKNDLDYEPWSEYKISGKILFDLVNTLKGEKVK